MSFAWLFDAWLIMVGLLFAGWPRRTSQLADALRSRAGEPVTSRQVRYARIAGILARVLAALFAFAMRM